MVRGSKVSLIMHQIRHFLLNLMNVAFIKRPHHFHANKHKWGAMPKDQTKGYFFSNFISCKCRAYSCSSTLSQILLKNIFFFFFGKVFFFFFKFWSCDFFRETKIRFFLAAICLFWVYVVQLLYRNSYGRVLKNEWVQVDPPLVHTQKRGAHH